MTTKHRDSDMKLPITILSGFLLVACSDQPDSSVSPTVSVIERTTVTPVPYAEFNTSVTIRDIMNTFIDPSADAIWQSVRFEMDETGSHEEVPDTDEEWEALRKQAISIIEGANALMMPGRHVAAPGSTTEFPQYEYRPEEVEQKLVEDRVAWVVFAQGLQRSALSVMDAIEARDVAGLSDSGGLVDEACENCHSQYWYRTGSAL
jgi:hypothetical protein